MQNPCNTNIYALQCTAIQNCHMQPVYAISHASTTIAIQSSALQYFSSALNRISPKVQPPVQTKSGPQCKPSPAPSANSMQSMLQCFNPSIRYHHCWRPHHQLCRALISRYTQLLNEISQHPNLNKQCNILPPKCT